MLPALPPLSSITLRDPFWLSWQQSFMEKGLAHQYEQCMTTGRFENFARASRGDSTGHQGYFFNDSDVYKWLEAAAYGLAKDPDWQGRQMVDNAIAIVAKAQDQDGYIGTPFQIDHKGKRWKSLTAKHEMYCIGHLIEAGVAHRDGTSLDSLFTVARRAADHVRSTFGPGLRTGYCGHQEIELALCRLSESTGDDSYRELAKWMTEARGSRPSPFLAEFDDPIGKELNVGYHPLVLEDGTYNGAYFQDDVPLADQTEAVGHAVRAMYFYSGAVDSCNDPAITRALLTIWSNMVRKKIYVTGGIGSSGRNEGFTTDFDLPNRDAYSETCAAIGLVFWASRMSRLTGVSKYAEVLELALYNAVLAGVNFETDRYFYVNPLESRGDHHRKPWFGCACCPPNIARLILSVQRYAAYWADKALTVDVPFSCAHTQEKTTFEVESEWPFGKTVEVRTPSGSPGETTLRLRIPDWATSYRATLNGSTVETLEHGYLVVRKEWSSADKLRVELKGDPTWLDCDIRVADNVGRRALKSGPLVYCLEEVDAGAPVHLFRPDCESPVAIGPGFSNRAPVSLQVDGSLEGQSTSNDLYGTQSPVHRTQTKARLIPYYAWGNRKPGSMAVWHRPE